MTMSLFELVFGMGWLRLVGSLNYRTLFQNRWYSAKETYNFKDPTNRSHPIASKCVLQFISHVNESCHVWMSHVVTYEWVMSRIHVSRDKWKPHVTHEQVMSHTNEYVSFSLHKIRVRFMYISYATYARAMSHNKYVPISSHRLFSCRIHVNESCHRSTSRVKEVQVVSHKLIHFVFCATKKIDLHSLSTAMLRNYGFVEWSTSMSSKKI